MFTNKQMDLISSLASMAPRKDIRQEILEEVVNVNKRKALNEKSQQRIKKWGNTIMGSRLKRLAAAKEKAEQEEAERKRVDEEWAKVRQKEREDAIKRAKEMQRAEEPRVRNLRSQLLTSNVLQERDMQLQYKVKRMVAGKIEEQEEILKMRLMHLKDLEKAKDQEELEHRKRYEFADGLRLEIERRASERQSLGKNELESYKAEASQIREEFKQKKVLDGKKKLEEAERIRNTLAEQIKEKILAKQEQENQIHEFEMANARFNSMKNMFAERRKEFTMNQALDRIKMSEHISYLNIDSQKEAEAKRTDFLTKIGKVDPEKTKQDDLKKHALKEQFVKEQELFLKEHNERKATTKTFTDQSKLKEREKNIELTQQWKEEVEGKHKRQKDTLMALKESHLQQMKENSLQKTKQKQEKMNYDASIVANSQREYEEFEEYAASKIREWKAAGKNVGPIIKTLEKEKRARKVAATKEIDHFSRLGFTARWLSSEPVIPE